MGILAGKVAIVTGAGKGIGKAEAVALAKEGAAVTLVARTYEDVVRVAKEIEAFGGRAIAVKCDVANGEQVKQAVAATVKAFGTVDILVNNAGVIPTPKPVVEWTEDQMRASWETGVLGSWLFMVACFPYMKNRDGRIINTCSGAGHGAIPGLLGYAATKEGIRSITRTAAREWGQYNVHVNLIAPAVKTPGVFDSTDAETEKMYLAMIPLNRWGDAEKDVGRVVVFLAGPDSSFMTGNTVSVDGGAAMVV
jgi:NAD(P)-dependent dehydrogenase (short-subunit alcohol dehydrogenase family)